MTEAILILRVLYGASLIGVVLSTLIPAVRAFTKRVKPKDFEYMLFFGLAANRMFFLWWNVRGDSDATPGQDTLLCFCFLVGFIVECGVMLSRWWNVRAS